MVPCQIETLLSQTGFVDVRTLEAHLVPLWHLSLPVGRQTSEQYTKEAAVARQGESFRDFELGGWEDESVCADYDEHLRPSLDSRWERCSMRPASDRERECWTWRRVLVRCCQRR